MKSDRIERIRFPRYYQGVRINHAGYPKRGYHVLAFDIETVKGWPYTLQFTGDGELASLTYLEPHEFLPCLIQQIQPYVNKHIHPNVVLFGFNLAYDLPALLYNHAKEFVKGTFKVRCKSVIVEVFYGRVPFAKMCFPNRRVVWIIDAYTFVWSSLAKAASTWNLPGMKYPKPKGLGTRVLRGTTFENYAKQDALLTWHLGKKILSFHQRYNIRLSVSIAQAAGRVFAHHFLKHPLPRPPVEVENAALLSYHGGKNGFYLDSPQWIENCYEYDIQSAYPWAMQLLPSMTRGTWKKVATYEGEHGFYCIGGIAKKCRYPILYNHEFQPLEGSFDKTWVTGYELQEAIRSDEVFVKNLEGWIWIPVSQDTPLKDYVIHFYNAKQQSTPGLLREQQKLLLNSLYGKFIQMTTEPVTKYEHPGVYFYPVLASWTTGAVRARMHYLEHRFESLHTATDAFHTRVVVPTGEGLGELELKQSGPAFLVRNKVYFHFGNGYVKYAHHGIRTTPKKLWKLLLQGKRHYSILHLLKPREAYRLGTRPLQPVWKSMRIELPPYRIKPFPKGVPKEWRK